MNINSHVLFNDPQFNVKKTDNGCLRISEGFSSEDILLTIFTLLGLFVFSFACIVGADHPSPSEFFQEWPFILALVMVFMALFYIWYKGFVLFNNKKGVITLKLYQRKFLGKVQFRYEDMAGIQVKISERLNQSNKTYLVYLFTLILKSGDNHKLIKVITKKQGRYIKTAIATHLDIDIIEST